jgi:WD40-like Beta Propeller Repeat
MKRLLIVALALGCILGLRTFSAAGDKLVPAVNLDKVNTPADEDDPFVLPDKTLLFASNASGHFVLMQSLWSRGWQKAKPIPGLESKDTDYRSPFYRNGDLYFTSNEVPDESLKDLKNYDLKKSTSGRAPLPLPGVSTKEDELHPWVTRDGREFYFSRKTKEGWKLLVAEGPTPGPIGDAKEVGFDSGFCHATVSGNGLIMYLQGPLENGRTGLFRSKRMSLKTKWSAPERLNMLNHPEAKRGDMSPCLSSDGKKLYFASDRPRGQGGLDLWSVDTSQLAKSR